jgi:methylenetetrahydrofolate dehydrogenase (NADP+)/methenyltetrahydrofolate cyclohydrolase
MSAQLLDGKVLATQIKIKLTKDVENIKRQYKNVPHLVSVLVGDDAGSGVYANAQKKNAESLGFQYSLVSLPKDISEEKLLKEIQKLNNDSSVHGVMIYQPLPKGIDAQRIQNSIDVNKDLEGMNEANLGRLLLGKNAILPCTPASALEHIKSTGIALRGKEAVIVGRSDIVGKPLSLLLLKEHLTVTICHSGTSEANRLAEHVGRADILVAAMGKPEFIKGDWVKKGSIVVDVGINKVNDKIVGDVEFEKAKERAAFITPVPGGVGPLTVVMLLRNALEAFKIQVS